MPRRSAIATLTGSALIAVAVPLSVAPSAQALAVFDLSLSPKTIVAGSGSVTVSGTGCFSPDLGGNGNGNVAGAPASAAPAADAAPAATDPAAVAAAPIAAAPIQGTVQVTIEGVTTGPLDADTQPGLDGSWSTSIPVLDSATPGPHTVQATCSIAGADVPIYNPATLVVTAPQTDPASITCGGCSGVNPGGVVSLSGNSFAKNGTVTVTLGDYPAQTAQTDQDGSFTGVTFTIDPGQAAGTLPLSVTDGTTTVPGQVVVKAVQDPSQPDGSVPPVTSDPGTGTDAGTGVTGEPVTYVPDYSATPGLARTGVDSEWMIVTGAALVLAGAGTLVLARRRTAAAEGTAA